MLQSYLQHLQRRFAPLKHDPMISPAELYYGELYRKEILGRLGGLAGARAVAAGGGTGGAPSNDAPGSAGSSLNILDVGCGVGRLLVPLAASGHAMTGIEAHHDSARRLRQNLAAASTTASIIEDDLVPALASIPDASFDAVMAIEVLYVNPGPERILAELARVVRPGGLLFVTHRPPLYYLLRALQLRHFDDAEVIASTMRPPVPGEESPVVASRAAGGGEARLRKGLHRVYYNWQLPERLGELYSASGLVLQARRAIGPCSGFGPDPLAAVCDPDALDGPQLEALGRIETGPLGDSDLGLSLARYILAIAERPATGSHGGTLPRAA